MAVATRRSVRWHSATCRAPVIPASPDALSRLGEAGRRGPSPARLDLACIQISEPVLINTGRMQAAERQQAGRQLGERKAREQRIGARLNDRRMRLALTTLDV